VKRLDEWLTATLKQAEARLYARRKLNQITTAHYEREVHRIYIDSALLHRHTPGGSYHGERYCVSCGSGEPYMWPTKWPCETLKLVAYAYRIWPGWRSEHWAPQAVRSGDGLREDLR
jgi:hypothetical protein